MFGFSIPCQSRKKSDPEGLRGTHDNVDKYLRMLAIAIAIARFHSGFKVAFGGVWLTSPRMMAYFFLNRNVSDIRDVFLCVADKSPAEKFNRSTRSLISCS